MRRNEEQEAVAVMTAVQSVVEMIVSRPDQVSVLLGRAGEVVSLDVRVARCDVGRVIGKGGMTAKSLRTIVAAMAKTTNGRYELTLPAGQGNGEVQ